jgi:glycine C-acetyltransferase
VLIDGVKLAKAAAVQPVRHGALGICEVRGSAAVDRSGRIDGRGHRGLRISFANRHNVGIMIDEAHSILALGEHGRGCLEHYGLPPSAVGLQYATFSKSFAHTGSFVGGKRELIRYLRHYVNGYAFSCALPPVVVGGVLKALELGARDNSLREKLWANVRHFREGAESLGLNLGDSTRRCS